MIVDDGLLDQIGGAFGAPLLGTALVVIPGSIDVRNERPEWGCFPPLPQYRNGLPKRFRAAAPQRLSPLSNLPNESTATVRSHMTYVASVAQRHAADGPFQSSSSYAASPDPSHASGQRRRPLRTRGRWRLPAGCTTS